MTNKYNDLLDAMDEFREAREEQLPNYDPHNYSKQDKEKRIAAAKERLDKVFHDIGQNHLLEARVIALEAEVKCLKEMVQALISRPAYPERTGPSIIDGPGVAPGAVPVVPGYCRCPISTGPHLRGSGCKDVWTTCTTKEHECQKCGGDSSPGHYCM